MPDRMPGSALLLLLAAVFAVLCAMPATAWCDGDDDGTDDESPSTATEDDEDEDEDSPYGVTIRIVDNSALLTDSNTGGGDGGSVVAVDSHSELMVTVVEPAFTLTVGTLGDFGLRDIDAATAALGSDPLNLIVLGLFTYMDVPFTDEGRDGMSAIFGGGVNASFEISAPIFKNTVSGWFYGGVALQPLEGLTLRLGGSLFLSLHETQFWPLVYVDWHFAPGWRIGTDAWSVTIGTELSPDLWLGLVGAYASAEYRHADSFAPAPAGIQVEENARVALTLDSRIGSLAIHVEAGARVWHETGIYDSNANKVDTVRIEPAAYLLLRLQLDIR